MKNNPLEKLSSANWLAERFFMLCVVMATSHYIFYHINLIVGSFSYFVGGFYFMYRYILYDWVKDYYWGK